MLMMPFAFVRRGLGESDGGVAVHHHEHQHERHHDDHADDVVVMEEQRDERESYRSYKGAGQNVGHTLADGGVSFVGEVAEDGQQDERGEVIARHDYADEPLNLKYLRRVAGLELRRGDAVHAPGKNVREERGAPRVIHLPEKQDAEERKAYQERSFVVELQPAGRSALRFTHEILPSKYQIYYFPNSGMSSVEIICSISSNLLTSSSGKRAFILSMTRCS